MQHEGVDVENRREKDIFADAREKYLMHGIRAGGYKGRQRQQNLWF